MSVHHVHLISDSTGGTLSSVVKACLSQFEGVKVEQHFWPLVRTQRQMHKVFDSLKASRGIVFYTIVDDALIAALEKFCAEERIPALSVLDPVMALMSL